MPQSTVRVRWHQPAIPSEAEKEAAPALVEVEPVSERDALRMMVLEVGIPVVEGAQTAREYATGLLQLAAEVEHALMAQYLYTTFSVPNELGPDSINYH